MKILVTGKGTSGSWFVRGQQLGTAMGISVQPGWPKPRGHDLAILVKRQNPDLLRNLGGIPIVWDIVDAYPQPSGNQWDRQTAMAWLREQMAIIRPIALVAATKAMAADLAQFSRPVLTLPHHARPNQELNPIRQDVHKVGYQGGEHYLGKWQAIVEGECRRRHWHFVINPETLAELDIALALRDQTGYPARFWKSAIKLANAQNTGTPIVLNPERGYLETQSGAEHFIETQAELSKAFDSLEDYTDRAAVSRIMQTAAPHLEPLADQYLAWLQALPSKS